MILWHISSTPPATLHPSSSHLQGPAQPPHHPPAPQGHSRAAPQGHPGRVTQQAAQVCPCPDDTQGQRSPRVVWMEPSRSCSCPSPQPVVPAQPSWSPKHRHQAQGISSTTVSMGRQQSSSSQGCSPKARAALAYGEVTAWAEQAWSSIHPFEPGQEVDFTLRSHRKLPKLVQQPGLGSISSTISSHTHAHLQAEASSYPDLPQEQGQPQLQHQSKAKGKTQPMSSRSSPEPLSPGEQHGQPDHILPSSYLDVLPAALHRTTSAACRALELNTSFPSKPCENESNALYSPGQGQQHQQLWQWEVRASAGPAAACLAHTQQQCLFCLRSASSRCIQDPSAASQHIPPRTEPSRDMAQPWCLLGFGDQLGLSQHWDALHSAGQSSSSDEHHHCAPLEIPKELRMEMDFALFSCGKTLGGQQRVKA